MSFEPNNLATVPRERKERTPQRLRKSLVQLPVGHFIRNEPPRLDFVLPGLLAKTVGVLVATGATGKSFLALQLLMSIASGADCLAGLFSRGGAWDGSLVTGGEKVVYVSLEDPLEVVWHRIRSCLDVLEYHKHGLTEPQLRALERNLSIVSPGREPLALDDEAWQQYLNALALGWGDADMDADDLLREAASLSGCKRPLPVPSENAPRLLVLDTFSRSLGNLDENKSGDMAGALSTLETAARLGGGAVLYIHHASKAATADGSEQAHAARGASPLTDNARFAMVMRRLTEADSGDPLLGCRALVVDDANGGKNLKDRDRMDAPPRWKSYVKASFPKMNYRGAGDGSVHFRRGENGVLLHAKLREVVGGQQPQSSSERKEQETPTQKKKTYKGKEIGV